MACLSSVSLCVPVCPERVRTHAVRCVCPVCPEASIKARDPGHAQRGSGRREIGLACPVKVGHTGGERG